MIQIINIISLRVAQTITNGRHFVRWPKSTLGTQRAELKMDDTGEDDEGDDTMMEV